MRPLKFIIVMSTAYCINACFCTDSDHISVHARDMASTNSNTDENKQVETDFDSNASGITKRRYVLYMSTKSE